MIIPKIRYYAKMVYDDNIQRKTPKYTVISEAGYYPPMEDLKNKKGIISMYLMGKRKEGDNVPSMRLQAKNSLNFTGLKEYFLDGKLSGYAYGNPLDSETYSSKKRNNPFYEYRHDGYLFIIQIDKTTMSKAAPIVPTAIELIVIEDGAVLIPSYCKQLIMGGFDEAINSLRKQAVTVDAYNNM